MMLRGKRILIVGAAGLLGREIVRSVIQRVERLLQQMLVQMPLILSLRP